MANLEVLKDILRRTASETSSLPRRALTDTQYSDGYNILVRDSNWTTYEDFIIPHLSLLLAGLSNSRGHLSVLEIGPGPRSVLGYLPDFLKRKIRRYAAFEPNETYAANLEQWLLSKPHSPLPHLDSEPNIQNVPFTLDGNEGSAAQKDERFDMILFCHSMYGMGSKRITIERALEMLAKRPEGAMVVVFHRDGVLRLDGLLCHRTASFPAGVTRVANIDEALDSFTSFIAGFVMQDKDADEAVHVEWRKVCRTLGRREEAHPDHLLFSSPNIMATFTQHATALPELVSLVPLAESSRKIKNRQAILHRPASIVGPTEVRHVQQCVEWALNHGVSLTVVGGGHSDHCLWPNVVAIDMAAFDKVHILLAGEDGGESGIDASPLVVAEAGCKTGDIVQKATAAGLTIPLGARPSVGTGLWLQGGIGHLARLHGLACDAIVGAVVVSVESGHLFCIGCVPSQCRPVGALRPENESDLLWAMKGAGTNFGIVISVTFRAYPARTYLVRNWVVPLSDCFEARHRLSDFDRIAGELPRNCSADGYLYWDNDQLRLGVTMFESSTTKPTLGSSMSISTPFSMLWGPEDNHRAVDGIGLFETEMYVSGMHGGHGGGKTSSFKRCLFLEHVGAAKVADILVAAVATRPSSLCYLHLLQGGGAVADVAVDATAFGCRDWDFACVITGIWPRDQDGTDAARAVVQWVYDVARDLLSSSSGVYGADLGPDPRDVLLAGKAFGPNRPRLARLKQKADPRNMLAYVCPLPKAPMEPKLVVLVTGESCAGKDYCAGIWVSTVIKGTQNGLTARAVSISDATKREYAAATGASVTRLLCDRAYKEQHRPALTRFFQAQVRKQPRLPEKHFLDVVYGAADVDVLLITGMRDEAPIVALSHLVPDSRLLEVRVKASEATRRARQECNGGDEDGDHHKEAQDNSDLAALDYRPSLTFDNDTAGEKAAEGFAESYLLPFLDDDLRRLADMVRPVPNFPRAGIEFRHVLGISQQLGGLTLCTSLLQTHFKGDWTRVGAVVSCEAGGFVYASPLAARVGVPLALIREAGKLPPPTISVVKPGSHISTSESEPSGEQMIEMERDVVPRGASVVVLDDVLATGRTLCAMLQLLDRAGISAEDVTVMVVAEFPVHRGRELLYRRGFGRVPIQSLLVFGGT